MATGCVQPPRQKNLGSGLQQRTPYVLLSVFYGRATGIDAPIRIGSVHQEQIDDLPTVQVRGLVKCRSVMSAPLGRIRVGSVVEEQLYHQSMATAYGMP